MRCVWKLIGSFVVLGAGLLPAQIGTSTITGRVVDATGAVVPGVNVTVISTATNFTFQSVTNDEGLYRVQSLSPGAYRVTFDAQGFKKVIQENVELRVGDVLAVNASMQVGSVTESVEVTGAPPQLETETSATGATMSGTQLYKLPLYQRYINSTMNLTPGMSAGGYTYGGSLGAYHLAGQRAGAIGVFEDGVNGNDQQGGTEMIKPIQNAVAEVKVISTVPPAEYGHSAGGVVNVVKKSGTNEYHGMASMYGRTRRMQHRLFFDKFRTTDFNPPLMNLFAQPDGNIGGPVIIPKLYNGKNKTFFFIGYQRLIEKKFAQVTASTPTPEMKAGDFSFGGLGNPIYDPFSTRQNPDGTWSRDVFPNNRIPSNRINPVAAKVLGIDPWVAPNQAGSFNANGPVSNLLANELALVVLDDYSGRFDHQFSSAFKLYGSITHNRQSGYGRPINIRNADFDGLQGNYSPFEQWNNSIGKTWVISPTLVNDARVGYYRRRNDTFVPSQGKNYASQLGIPNVDPSLLPQFGTSTNRDSADSLYGLTGAGPSRQINETISFRDDLTKIVGRHAFKMGYELLRFRLNSTVTNRPSGAFYFDGMTAGLQPDGNAVPRTGNTFAGFLTGAVRQATFDAELTSWLPRSSIHSFYFQDDWKVSPTLTLNLGLRYSNESPFTTKYGLMSNFDPTAKDDVTGRTGGLVFPTSGLNRRDNNNFQPRVGAAWHPMERLVFRGGFGLYTVDVKFPALRVQFNEFVAVANQQQAPGDPRPIYSINQGPNPVKFNIRSNNSAPYSGSNYGTRNVDYWDPNLRNPYTMNWNGGIQYQLSKDYTLDVNYQGSAGVGLLERWQYNTFSIDAGASDPALRAEIFRVPQNYRPFNQFGDVLMRSNFGHSTYHGGTIKLDRRMSNGLIFSTFYTFSKAINSQDSDNDGSGVAPLQNRSLEKGRAGYDRNHRFVGWATYELPFGRGKRWISSGKWKNFFFGGYEVTWIQTYESGNPLTFSFANSPYNYFPTYAGNRRPNVVGTPELRDNWRDFGGDRFNSNNINPVIDMSAFAYPAAFTPGNAGRNIMTGTPTIWSQASAQKNFTFGERVRAQIRWDMQNVLKTFNFNPPTTTVDFQNPQTFGKITSDPRTASGGGQPLMNLTLMVQF